jgi:hypothetical protein
MPDKPVHQPHPLPVENYSRAIASAIEWLGDRYLLARPINPRHGHESERNRSYQLPRDEIVETSIVPRK